MDHHHYHITLHRSTTQHLKLLHNLINDIQLHQEHCIQYHHYHLLDHHIPLAEIVLTAQRICLPRFHHNQRIQAQKMNINLKDR